MVNNPYFFSTMATAPSTQIADSSDNPHSGLIKALSIGMTGSYAIKAGNDFAITVASASTVTVAAGKILRDGLKVDISASGTLTLGTVDSAGTTKTNTLYSLIVVAANNSLAIRTTTTEEAVPAYTLGDIPIALLLYTGDSATMEIQFLTTNKTDNSLTLAYESSSDFTPTATFTSASGGTTITNTIGDFTIDNQDTNDQIILQLGTDTDATAVVVKDDSGNNKFAITGGGKTQAMGTLEVGTDLKMSTSSDHAIIENVTSNKDIIFQVNDGGSANTEVMRIDGENSRVGIGTDTPTTQLEVSGDTTISRSADLGQTRTLSIEGARNAAGADYARIDLQNYDSTSGSPATYVGARISAANDADGVDDGSLVLSTANAGTLAERMRIKDSGEVVIGTDLQLSTSSDHVTIQNVTQDKDIIFKVNDGGVETEVLRISGDDGYIGVGGITAPSAQLHIRSSVTQQPEIRLENTNGDAQEAVIRFMKNTASPASSDDIGLIRFEGENDAGGNHLYSYILGQMITVADGAEAGELLFFTGHKGNQYQVLALTGSTSGDGEVAINDGGRDDINFRVEGDTEQYLLFTDAANDRVSIGHNSPAAMLDIDTGGTFRNTRLLTVSVSGSTTLTEAAHAGRYNICAGNITLPSTSTAGEHYAILNTTGGDITIGRNGNNINGAGSDITLATYKAATCIAIGSNNWMVVG